MADFDEYDYLEKAVEESNHRPSDGQKKDKTVEQTNHSPSGDREKDKIVEEKTNHRKKEKPAEETNRRSSGDREKDRHRRDRDDDNVTRRRSHDRDSDRDRKRHRESDRSDRKRRRSRSPVKEAEPSRRSNKARKEEADPEADPERDQKTVFAFQIPLRANEKDIYEFFSKAGKVRDVRLIMDRISRRSKGFAYIEFFEVVSVPMAIALSGHHLLGQPVLVKPSEAEKNLVPTSATMAQERKLYVENLHFNFTEVQLRQIFESFGQLELVQLPTEPGTGQCKGYAFVQFVLHESALAAKSSLNDMEIGGKVIRVSEYQSGVRVQDKNSEQFDDVDDDGMGKLALNAQSRASLMAKLDRNGSHASMATITMPIVGPTMSVPPSVLATQELVGIPSQCLLLRNMFDPAGLDDEGFEEIRDDVRDECSKYGAVHHVYVDRNSRGCVYLRFLSVEAAVRAQQAMHGRWFACRQISAIYLQAYEFDAKLKGLTANAW